jgi:hypothetical protein
MGRFAVKFLLLSVGNCCGRDGFNSWPLRIAQREIGIIEIEFTLAGENMSRSKLLDHAYAERTTLRACCAFLRA